jgi:hypothetical protein
MNRETLLLYAKHELCQALLKCTGMQNLADRQRVINNLSNDIKIRIIESSEPLTHTQNIIDQCVAFPDGLRCFLSALADHIGPTHEFLKIMPIALGVELMRILQDEEGITDAKLSIFFNNSRPGLMRPRQAAHTWDEIQFLWGMQTPQGERSPILCFVDQIIAVSSANKDELVDWENWALTSEHLSLQSGDLVTRDEHNNSGDPYLTIVVKPLPAIEGDIQAAYEVSTHLWEGQIQRQLAANARFANLQVEMPLLVTTAIDEASLYLGERTPDLLLEFYLPDELMSEDIDRLPRPDEPTCWFGMDYPVVVRPLQRLLDDTPGARERRSRWKSRWRLVKERIKTDNPAAATIWLCSGVDDDFSQIEIHLRDHAKRICYLGIPFLLGKDKDIGKSVLQLALRVGVPVALWPRPHGFLNDVGETHDFVSSILCDEHSSHAPWQLKKRRLERYAQKTHPSNHVTLLWDDADRIPPPWNSRPLTSPQESEGSA